MDHERLPGVRGALLRWYGRHRRDLPWRRTRAPYRIWVSEVMLQQTRVETVIPYYRRFLRRFPTARALAEASPDAVLKSWEGLGYYARARNLHRAAQIVRADLGGRFPDSPDEWLRFPGVGRSTAATICSIAFGRDAAALDGNIARVLCRVFRIRKNPRESSTRNRLWTIARELLPPGRAGEFNQALMDLGATVCTPRRPNCPACPVARHCEARARGEEEKLPVKSQRKPSPHYDVAIGIIRRGRRLLIDRRKPEGLLGGLWEFPGGKRKEGETLERCLAREVREELGARVKVLRPLVAVRHAYTHFRITLHAFECRYLSGPPRAIGCAAWRWVKAEELDDYAFPSANRKIIRLITS